MIGYMTFDLQRVKEHTMPRILLILPLIASILSGCGESKTVRIKFRYVDNRQPVTEAYLFAMPTEGMLIPYIQSPFESRTDQNGEVIADLPTHNGKAIEIKIENPNNVYHESIHFVHPYYRKNISWVTLSEIKESSRDPNHRAIEMEIKLHGKAYQEKHNRHGEQ